GCPPRRRGCVQGARTRASDRGGARRQRLDEGRDVKIAVADYGAGNLRSVCSGFERAGAEPVVTTELRDAPLAVIAGVGNAGSAAVVATVEHDGPVAAGVERGALAGVQFHPERSGAAGGRILRNVLRWSSGA